MNWSKIKKGLKQFAYLNWHDIAQRMEKVGANVHVKIDGIIDRSGKNEIMDNYKSIEIGYELPDNVGELTFSEGATPEEMGALIASAQGEFLKEDLDDNWLDYAFEVGSRPPTDLPHLPENYTEMYLPAGGRLGKKPNMNAIRFWVINQKMATMSDEEIINEYYRYNDEDYFDIMKGEGEHGMKNEQEMYNQGRQNIDFIKKSVIDGATYRVSRKIWYVGRKPRWMSDTQWDEHTKHMRPPEGSFGEKDIFTKFPYDINYKYESGYD